MTRARPEETELFFEGPPIGWGLDASHADSEFALWKAGFDFIEDRPFTFSPHLLGRDIDFEIEENFSADLGGDERHGGRRRWKNLIKKGKGIDSTKDPRDGYRFERGYWYPRMREIIGTWPSANFLFSVCRLIESNCRGLSTRNRWAKRRTPNAWAWLDENRAHISQSIFTQAVMSTLRYKSRSS